MILVTGATGHLGANLVRRLTADGQEVRVTVRPGSPDTALAGLTLQRVHADLRDPASIRTAVAGCHQIYHCAAQISTGTRRERETYECNVIGTRNLLAAARDANVERVVVTGSLSAIGHVAGRPATEADPFYPFDKLTPYAHTKAIVEHECLKAAVDGLNVVIAVSTAIVGPNDFGPSRLGRVLLKAMTGKLWAAPAGGFAFVAAQDVVAGHLLAMANGRQGHKCLLSTEFLTMQQLLELCRQIAGVSRRPVRIPAQAAAGVAALWGPVTRSEGLNSAAVRFLRQQRQANCAKAINELGYRPTAITQAVADAYGSFAGRGLVAR